jgi:hypothetical protein
LVSAIDDQAGFIGKLLRTNDVQFANLFLLVNVVLLAASERAGAENMSAARLANNRAGKVSRHDTRGQSAISES